MDRRGFLSRAAMGAGAAGAATLAAPAISQGRKQLRVVTTWPKNFPGLGTAPEKVAQRVSAMTNGQVQMRVYAAGELVPAFEVFDAVASGAADAYHGADYYWQGQSRAFNFFCAAPMGLTAVEYMSWLRFGGGQDLWDELSGGFGIKPIPCANTGHQMGGWFKKEINSLDDFVGLKMRIPGLGGAVVRALGGAPVTMPGSEIYQSLQSGAIDATEWVGPWNDLAFGFYREAQYYYGPGFHEPGAQLTLAFNREVWDELTSEQQAIVEQACLAVNNDSIGEFSHYNAQALTTLTDTHGVQLRSFPDDVWAAVAEASNEVLFNEDDDAITTKVRDSYLAARANLSRWASISDAPYFARRRAALG